MLRKHLALLVAYSIVAVVFSFPLILNMSTAIPGLPGDATSFVWAFGLAKAAIADLHVNPFHTDNVFYPLGGATQLLWAVSLPALVSIPLQLLFGLVTAHNVLYLAATVLTAYGTYLLAEYVLTRPVRVQQPPSLTGSLLSPFATLLVAQFVIQKRVMGARGSILAAFTAGLVFAFAPLRLGYGLAFLNLYNTELIPFYMLFLLRAIDGRARTDVLVAGILLGLNAYIDFQIAAFLVLVTAVYAVCRWLEWSLGRERLSPIRALKTIALPLIPVAFLSIVVALPMLGAVANDFAIEGGNYIGVYKLEYSAARSFDLLSFVLPNARSSLYATSPFRVEGVNAAPRPDDETPRSPDRQAFVGFVAFALGVFAALRRWRIARLWAAIALLFFLFSLGPWLHVAGQLTGVPLPFIALHEIPFVNSIRVPMRYAIIVDLALAVLAALAIKELQVILSSRRFPILISGLGLLLIPLAVLAEYAMLPYPVQAFSIPPIYEKIARKPGDFTVLEIPSFNWRYAAATEVYQAVHEKRILRAYTNRIAPDIAEYFGFRGTPIVVRSLRMLEGAEKGELPVEDIAEDRRVRDAVLGFYDLRYAIVHKDMLAPDQLGAIQTYVHDVLGGSVVSDDAATVAFELPQVHPPDSTIVDLRENIGQMYAGRGWQFQYPPANWNADFNFVWAKGARSEVYFTSADASERTLVFHAFADSPQHVSLSLNGQTVGQADVGSEWKDYSLRLPEGIVRSGMNRIDLLYSTDLQEAVGFTTIQIRRGQNGAETNR